MPCSSQLRYPQKALNSNAKTSCRRVVELVDRFERKLNKLEDKEMYALIRDVVIPLSELLTRSRASADATLLAFCSAGAG